MGKKSDLLICLEQNTQVGPLSSLYDKVLDGGSVVHFFFISNITAFSEYASDVFPTS